MFYELPLCHLIVSGLVNFLAHNDCVQVNLAQDYNERVDCVVPLGLGGECMDITQGVADAFFIMIIVFFLSFFFVMRISW